MNPPNDLEVVSPVRQRFLSIMLLLFTGAALLVYVLRNLFFNFSHDIIGRGDWDLNLFYFEFTRRSVIEYHQLPIWNPFYLGGMPVFENPQIAFFSPTNILTFIFGTVVGVKMAIMLYYVLGFLGSAFLFRKVLNAQIVPTLAGMLIFLGSGFFVQHLYAGHTQFHPALLTPWYVAFELLALRAMHFRKESGWSIAAGLVLALMIIEGSLYPVLMLPLATSIYLLLKDVRQAPRVILVTGIVALACGLYRIVPEISFYLHGNYFTRRPEGPLTFSQIMETLFNEGQHPEMRHFGDAYSAWWEYGNYIGVVPLLYAGISIFFVRKRDIPLLGIIALTLLFCLGDFGTATPSHWLHQLPIFGRMNAHGRWTFLLVFFLSLFLVQGLSRAGQTRFGKVLMIVLIPALLFQAYELKKINGKIANRIFEIKVPEIPAGEFKTIAELPRYGADSAMFPAIKANLSTRNGYEMMISPVHAIASNKPDYKGEFYLNNAGQRISPLQWSPGRIRFQVESDEKDLLIVNQNFNKGWQCDRCTIIEHEGRIALSVQRGLNDFTLHIDDWFYSILILLSVAAFISVSALVGYMIVVTNHSSNSYL